METLIFQKFTFNPDPLSFTNRVLGKFQDKPAPCFKRIELTLVGEN
jgi:hypothetical protein